MSTTARKSAATMPTGTTPEPAAPREQKPATEPAVDKTEPKSEPETLIEALTTGQASLTKVRANGTKRSLPYLAEGTEQRKQAEAVAKMREDGQAVDGIAEALKVSTATARRFLFNLPLAHAVEAGAHNKAWRPGTREVVVLVVPPIK